MVVKPPPPITGKEFYKYTEKYAEEISEEILEYLMLDAVNWIGGDINHTIKDTSKV